MSLCKEPFLNSPLEKGTTSKYIYFILPLKEERLVLPGALHQEEGR